MIANWDAVFASAAQRGVAIEIDGDPARQDLDHTLAARALEAGCLFALDSDAHTTTQLSYAETALAHARLAGIPAERIVNCWPLDRLLAWLSNPFSELERDLSPCEGIHAIQEPGTATEVRTAPRGREDLERDVRGMEPRDGEQEAARARGIEVEEEGDRDEKDRKDERVQAEEDAEFFGRL